MGLISRIKTWINKEVLTHTDLNAEFDNITDNIVQATTLVKGVVELATDAEAIAGVDTERAVTPANVPAIFEGVANKAIPVDADKVPLVDTEAANVLKTSTWANTKATLKTYFDTLYLAISGGTLTGTLTVVTGTTTVAPIKMIAGTNLTTPIAGVIEFDGTDFYITV